MHFRLSFPKPQLFCVALLCIAFTGCNEREMQPLKDLDAYCRALGSADQQVDLQKDHEAQMAAILEDLKKRKVAPEFLKLVRMAASLSAPEIHNTVRSYAEIHKIRFSCSKVDLQIKRKNQERQARINAAKTENQDAESLKKAEIDPTYVPADDLNLIRTSLSTYLQKLRNNR